MPLKRGQSAILGYWLIPKLESLPVAEITGTGILVVQKRMRVQYTRHPEEGTKRKIRYYLPAGISLVPRWDKLENHPDLRIPEEERANHPGFFYSQEEGWKILIYMVVDDIFTLNRQIHHILDQYESIDYSEPQISLPEIPEAETLGLKKIEKISQILRRRNLAVEIILSQCRKTLTGVSEQLERMLTEWERLKPLQRKNLLHWRLNALRRIHYAPFVINLNRAEINLITALGHISIDEPDEAKHYIHLALKNLRKALNFLGEDK